MSFGNLTLIDPPGEHIDLRPLTDAAEYNQVPEAEKLAIGGKALADLGSKLSGGSEHQHPR